MTNHVYRSTLVPVRRTGGGSISRACTPVSACSGFVLGCLFSADTSGLPCESNEHCQTGQVCVANTCRDNDSDTTAQDDGTLTIGEDSSSADTGTADTCANMVQDGDESDVDCGGGCFGCQRGMGCAEHSDCLDGVCTEFMCAEPTCEDGVKNGAETDIDCGTTCSPCGDGLACMNGGDCASAVCTNQRCAAPDCDDAVQNGNETDLDCGGDCPNRCMDFQGCAANEDCSSGVCDVVTMVCAAPTCGDVTHNGSETDIDCGGDACNGCAEGLMCTHGSDCLSEFCNQGLCQPQACDSDDDCDTYDGDCTQGVCNTMTSTCESAPANNLGSCEDGAVCTTGEYCSEGSCVGGTQKDCSQLTGACTLGVCDPADGECTTLPANEGVPCEDGVPCTDDFDATESTCQAGVCVAERWTVVWIDRFEDLDTSKAFWKLGPTWEIGRATASPVSETSGADPEFDHSPSDDNHLAGVLIGGLTELVLHDYYHLTSSAISLESMPGTPYPPGTRIGLWYWIDVDYPEWQHATIDLCNPSDGCVLAVENTGYIEGTTWLPQYFDIATYFSNVPQTMTLDVAYNQINLDGAWAVGGWSIDDVALCIPK